MNHFVEIANPIIYFKIFSLHKLLNLQYLQKKSKNFSYFYKSHISLIETSLEDSIKYL